MSTFDQLLSLTFVPAHYDDVQALLDLLAAEQEAEQDAEPTVGGAS